MLHYHYPGNVGDLENIDERAVALTEDEEISGTDVGVAAQILNIPRTTLWRKIKSYGLEDNAAE